MKSGYELGTIFISVELLFWSNRDPDEDAVQDGGADTEVETKGKKKTKKKKHSKYMSTNGLEKFFITISSFDFHSFAFYSCILHFRVAFLVL